MMSKAYLFAIFRLAELSGRTIPVFDYTAIFSSNTPTLRVVESALLIYEAEGEDYDKARDNLIETVGKMPQWAWALQKENMRDFSDYNLLAPPRK